MFEFLANLFGFGKAVLTEVAQRDAEKNTADQRSNEEAAQIQKDRDQARKAINAGDDDELSREVEP